jgi:Zn-dependent metalloprotease
MTNEETVMRRAMSCTCFIIPADVLARLAGDKKLPPDTRKALVDSARISDAMRKLRVQNTLLSAVAQDINHGFGVQVAPVPKVLVDDCNKKQLLPGTPVASPKTSKDKTAQRAFVEATSVARFYKQVFGRNSVDDAGLTLLSSVHFGVNYNNAFWNGQQMVYGDGDGKVFTDFTGGNDVIGHELTHGVTQYSLQLAYTGDAGGLNESVSDCFGSMFRQWEANQDVTKADWLIGSDLMGAAAKAKGYTCLRDMSNPASKKALAAQPAKYSQLTPGMDPHYTSGPPNLAFYTACMKQGGKSWDRIGQVWYAALTTSGVNPTMTMPQFAARTRQVATQLYPKEPTVTAAVDAGWKAVGL